MVSLDYCVNNVFKCTNQYQKISNHFGKCGKQPLILFLKKLRRINDDEQANQVLNNNA